jgi:hypothetical protein
MCETLTETDLSGWTGFVPSKPEFVTRTEFPIACSLGPDDSSARLARWSALRDLAAPVAHLHDGELEVRYRSVPGVLEELERLALAEQACCSFVTWVVRDDCGQPTLHVIAPPDSPGAVRPIAAMFGVDVSTDALSPGVGS